MASESDDDATGGGRGFMEGLGRAIKVLRTTRDLSRKQLAERSGLSYSYLAEIENSVKLPSSRALAAIAQGLGLQPHELVESAEVWSRDADQSDRPGGLSQDRLVAAMEAPALAESRDARSRRARTGGLAESFSAAFRRKPAAAESNLLVLGEPERTRGRVPPQLLEEIHAGNCTAFLGAGFSAAAQLPDWKGLLTALSEDADVARSTAAHVANCVRVGSAHALDEAAQVLEDELGRAAFLAKLEERMGHPPMTPPMENRIRWLRGIPFRSILTTNFDGTLSGASASHDGYRNALRPRAYRWWDRRYWGEAEGAFTLKLHGDLATSRDTDTDIVLTRRDYRRRLYEDPAYETFLRSLMATTTVLYMGFSFEDAYLNELRSEILALLGQERESAPVAYAIVNDVPDATRRHFLWHEGIEILSYDTRGGSDFSGFDEYLYAIYEATNPLLRFARYLEHKRILWVDPHPENNEFAFEQLSAAAEEAGREGSALVLVSTADEGIQELERSEADSPFDLVITHWGSDAARDREGRPTSTAERLLTEMRARDLRSPVIIFAMNDDFERRKRTALGLGAQTYCFLFEDLFQAIERVFAPGAGR